jgi:hypothetical protein
MVMIVMPVTTVSLGAAGNPYGTSPPRRTALVAQGRPPVRFAASSARPVYPDVYPIAQIRPEGSS